MLDDLIEKTLAIVLAGGQGSRLAPLTNDRAKPAVPFGGKYRIIDFVLSNCFHSGLNRVFVLTQYKPRSLIDHLGLAWNIGPFMRQHSNYFIDHFDAEMALDNEGGYKFEGTADAVRRTVQAIMELSPRPQYIFVLSGDHVYKMNYRTMLRFHAELGADVMVSTKKISMEDASSFGIVEESGGRITGFVEKPKDLSVFAGMESLLANMGIYLFNADFLLDELKRQGNDFGYDILPRMVEEGRNVLAYDFSENNWIRERIFNTASGRRIVEEVDQAPDSDYWRDVGTLKSFWDAHMDLVGINPNFNLYGELHNIITFQHQSLPPFKLVHNSPYDTRHIRGSSRGRVGRLVNSIAGEGSIVSGSCVENSVLGRQVIVHSWAEVLNSVIFDHANIGRSCTLRNTILDKGVEIEEGVVLGYSRAEDERLKVVDKITGEQRTLGFEEIPNGYVVAVPKNARVNF